MASSPVSVIEMESYRRRAEEMLTADERDIIITLVAYAPLAGKIIPGTGGLRKIRIGRDGIGKRGGARVVYFFHSDAFPILLMALYAKNEKEDLTAGEQRTLAEYAKEFIARWKRR